MPSTPSGLSGKTPCNIFNKNKIINPNILNETTDTAYFFHVISSFLSILIILYIKFSTGTNTLDKNTFSPSITLLIYFPSGIANTIRITKYRPYCNTAFIIHYPPLIKCKKDI